MKFLLLISVLVLAYVGFALAGDIAHNNKKVVQVDASKNGFWQSKLIWKPRWVKAWHEKKIYVAYWKKVWGPVQLKEWVPLPKPPPGWTKPDQKHVHLHHHHKVLEPVTEIRPVVTPVHTVHKEPHPFPYYDHVHHTHPHPHDHHDLHAHHGLHDHHDLHAHHDHHSLHDHHHPSPIFNNPNVETFSPQFLPISLEDLKAK